MSEVWNKGYAIDEIARAIENAKKVTVDGQVSFEEWNFKTNERVIAGAFRWHLDVPEAEKSEIAFKAISNTGRIGVITPQALSTELQKLQSAYLAQPLTRFVLVTTISAKYRSRLQRVKVNEALIIFGEALPQRFQEALARFLTPPRRRQYPQPPNDYLRVRIYITARSGSDAAAKAFDAID